MSARRKKRVHGVRHHEVTNLFEGSQISVPNLNGLLSWGFLKAIFSDCCDRSFVLVILGFGGSYSTVLSHANVKTVLYEDGQLRLRILLVLLLLLFEISARARESCKDKVLQLARHRRWFKLMSTRLSSRN